MDKFCSQPTQQQQKWKKQQQHQQQKHLHSGNIHTGTGLKGHATTRENRYTSRGPTLLKPSSWHPRTWKTNYKRVE